MKKFFTFIAFLLLCFALGYVWYTVNLSPVNDDGAPHVLKIPKGSSVIFIANELEKQNLIRSANVFRFYVARQGKTAGLQAGSFALNSAMSVSEIVDALSGGKAGQIVITVPEGFTVKDIDALLAAKNLIKAGDLIACAQTCDFNTFAFLPLRSSQTKTGRGGLLEGFLYPETYFVLAEGFEPKFFLERMLGLFRDRVVVGLKQDIKDSKRSLDDIVIMASLIEAETRAAAERPVVAGILWKRHDAKMGLGVDATVRYILEKPTAALTDKDLAIDSYYNLRKYRGLPPGPIDNPGLSAIIAALHPEDSPYFYYLHDHNGFIHYAMTNEEQNENRARYLQ